VVEGTNVETIKDILSRTWDNILGRIAIFSVVLGWVPATLLSMAHSAMRN